MTGVHDRWDKRNKGEGRAEMVSSLFLEQKRKLQNWWKGNIVREQSKVGFTFLHLKYQWGLTFIYLIERKKLHEEKRWRLGSNFIKYIFKKT